MTAANGNRKLTSMSVAKSIINKLGGVAKVAEITGLTTKQIHCWTYERTRGGTGGLIPAKHQSLLLDAARLKGIELGPADFFPPAKDAAA